MMINKRLINTVPNAKKTIAKQVLFQWIALVANIAVMGFISYVFVQAYNHSLSLPVICWFVIMVLIAIGTRYFCSYQSAQCSYESSKIVKSTYRDLILRKVFQIGKSYGKHVNTSEIVQIAVEGIDQLETYFGQYLPQLFYSLLAPLTLFIVIAPLSFKSAFILFICVPLIPITIILVQKWAKKLLSKYWVQYTALGDTFLENLQGLTTTKIYQSDAYKHQQMNKESENFRKITMKVLTMQLNSITIMDIIAYGGAAVGMIVALVGLRQGELSLFSALFILLLAADFFLPMRLLGSYFHIAMNGMAASDKMFRLLDIPVNSHNAKREITSTKIRINDLSFGYEASKNTLNHIDMTINPDSFIGIIGESGCGKSTLAGVLTGKLTNYSGTIMIGNIELSEASAYSLNKTIMYIGNNAMIFKGSVRNNLLMGNPYASDAQLWDVLDKVNLANFLHSENGLDTLLHEKGSNLSGGQRQRLALARALLAESAIYIFDEATSNIDADSEAIIMNVIEQLAINKTVILISHRLANVKGSDVIYVMDNGSIVQQGTFKQLSQKDGQFKTLWDLQYNIEHFLGKEA